MVINPWGEIIADCNKGEALLIGTLDFDSLDSIRASLPSLRHRRVCAGGELLSLQPNKGKDKENS